MGERLRQNFQSFLIRLRRKEGQAGNITTWMCKARDQSSPHWISRDRNNNRGRTGRSFGSLGGQRVHRDADIYIETDELGSERRETVNLAFRVSVLDTDALSFDPSEVSETFSECIYLSGDGGVGVPCQRAYSRDPSRRLLGERAMRPRGGRAA